MSELETMAVPLLLGLAAACALTGMIELARRPASAKPERWRDPAPRLFRALLPAARQIAIWIRLSPERRHHLHQRLEAAGVGYAVLPEELVSLRMLIGGGAIALTALFAVLGTRGFDAFALCAVAGLAGTLYPDLWLIEHRKHRQRAIERHLPGWLELLALSVRAGLGFGAALGHTTEHLPDGPLKAECQRLNREIRTGFSRQDALTGFAARTRLTSVEGFVAAMIQADETGAAISPVLADQARQRRRERFAAAEKKANEAPVRMLLPLVGLLFPVTFLIIGFPIALQFMDGGLT